jgi:homoserine dehydrogenase
MATSLRHFEQNKYGPAAGCKVAIVGFGTVGRAVANLLLARDEEHALALTHICNRRVASKIADWIPAGVMWTEDVEEVLASDVDVIIELLGGLEPAHDWVRRALQSPKSVVTANKQLMAHFGSELLDLAWENEQYLGFEACVAAGVPVISGLQDGLAGDRITRVCGILNGTCNYILTKIEQQHTSFAGALREAQQAGFAEADPTDDIDGLDAAAKLVILARAGLNIELKPEQVMCRSIKDVSFIDFEYAQELGCTIRQVSTAEVVQRKGYAVVEPTVVRKSSSLAAVSGSQNLVVSTGAFGGETVFSGYGAGGNPTAVAVLSDLLKAARHKSNGFAMPHRPAARPCEMTSDLETRHYVRFIVRDKPGIIAAIAGVFSQQHINVDAVLQKPGYLKSELPFVITLEPCHEGRVEEALAQIREFDFLVKPPLRMPIVHQEESHASAL